jgi:hypothetical protein
MVKTSHYYDINGTEKTGYEKFQGHVADPQIKL